MAYGYGGGFRGGSGGFRGGGGFRRDFRQERTKIKCAECGKEDEVPFKPREGSPVYCKDCFLKKKGITPRSQDRDVKEQSGFKKDSEESEESEGEEEFEETEEGTEE